MCPAGHPLSLGLHDSTRPVLPRPPTISNPPPLISSTKHPGVLDRQVSVAPQGRRGGQPPGAAVQPGTRRTAPSFWGCGCAVCGVGPSGPLVSGWGPGSCLCSLLCWGPAWLEPPQALEVTPQGSPVHVPCGHTVCPWESLNLCASGFPSVKWETNVLDTQQQR